MPRNPYTVLGVERDVSSDALKKAYRKLAKKFHPDVNPGDKNAEERFKEVNAAFEVLSDPEKRQIYDELGDQAFAIGFDKKKAETFRQWQAQRQRAGAGPRGGVFFEDTGEGVGGFDFSDLFSQFFSGAGRGPFGGFRGGEA